MKGIRNLLATTVVMIAVSVTWISARAQGEITLLAPGPARETIDKIIANFQSKTGNKVKVTYVNMVFTRQSVAKGQPLDVNLMAAPFPAAIASGSIVLNSRTPVATLLTAIAVPKGSPKPDISTAAAVKKALLSANTI